ncbi:histidine phosphatase family protein [Metabacillus fastidiosus]|uniref:Histidine phosphatase family protein n=1 Tax=Metabacillus fastidiosus TaxID=1458 RepID=A0ABU6NU38_9BACI|nr:histidine phosphatase family protein [Metabacillus fastidiosus]
MDISLIRHGKSTFTENKKINCEAFQSWVKQYDCNGVFEEDCYPAGTTEIIKQAHLVITSNLKRSIDSAKILNPAIKTINSSLFCETELPIPSKKLGAIKLNPNTWAIILRCLWFLGYSNGCESYNEARQRAKEAARVLVDYANEHTSVVLVGHGFFNRLIGTELKKMNWKNKTKMSSKHWRCTTYFLNWEF